MSATLLRAVPAAAGQVLAVWRALPGAYLLLGRAPGPMPKSGSARLARNAGIPGMFRTFSWSNAADQSTSYLMVVRLPDRLEIRDESEIILRGARGVDRDFALRLAPFCEEVEFGRNLASLAAASAAAVARFILDLIRPEAEVDVRRPLPLLESFLHHAARHEGCVELLLEIPERILLLQGWGPPTGGDVELVLTAANFARHTIQVGEFSRNDIKPPLTGSILALPAELAATLAQMPSVYLLTPTEILCRRILDSRVLDPVSSGGQIRHLLPRLACPPALAATLERALQPQFGGVDTLNRSERPIRAAIDIAVAAEGAGVFLSGWLFDPSCQVARIDYCDADHTIRIDPDIVRVDRADVLLAFSTNASFPRCSRTDIGFAVSASMIGPIADRPHLRFTFIDGDITFMPLALRSTSEPGIRAKLCASIDMHKPSGLEIVERHLAPILAKAAAPALTGARVLLAGPLGRPHAVVVPLTGPTLPRSVIAGLLSDPLTTEEQIIFVRGPNWSDERTETLVELLRFYDLPATLIATPDSVGPVDALLAASEHCQADTFLVVSAAASSGGPKSRQALRDLTADAVCPTVLYEDGSIRFAGATELAFVDRAPFVRLHSPWLGLSAEHLSAHDPANALGGTLECCLLTRDALAAAVRARRFCTTFGQEAALFAELRARGRPVLWQPAVVVATADDVAADPTRSATALVDNWALRANWGDVACAS